MLYRGNTEFDYGRIQCAEITVKYKQFYFKRTPKKNCIITTYCN